ncbi:glucokinase [Actinopolymorpha cephalotaxi]|uniref:Glucokinase n=1 Tax=Actinopolymorpha cephalotaxi TaxID=504797 RepID=A0A1I2NMN3_9ACTN|nr:ROK family protein [Actinopolymorpha cephalotaxi]NYH85523.1 glucokinase [Actinopolymorpha cephalotaxi]SFG02957.1 glucokinase [Actinopolymorpha cephalotaxi]
MTNSPPAEPTQPEPTQPEPTQPESTQPVIGVDVGGRLIKAAVVYADGRVGARAEEPTPPARDADTVLSSVVSVVAGLRERTRSEEPYADVAALGVAVPGIIDEQRGVAVMAANLGWRDTPVRALLSEATGLPVALGHDVRAACVAEWQLGAARESADALLVTLGTSIGAGVVSDGRLLVGGGYAGQLGHVVVDPGGARCTCGQYGCLATLASATAVVRRYTERAAATGTTTGTTTGTPADLTARDVARLARTGDPAAAAVWEEAVTALADALASAVTVFGSELVVLGGGLALAGDQLVDPVRERLLTRLTFQRRPRVVRAAMGAESGVLGAALLGRAALLDALPHETAR